MTARAPVPPRRGTRLGCVVIGVVAVGVFAALCVGVFFGLFSYPGVGARDFFRAHVTAARQNPAHFLDSARDDEARAAYEAIQQSSDLSLSWFTAVNGAGVPFADMLNYHCIDGFLVTTTGTRRPIAAVVTEHVVRGSSTFEVLELSVERPCTCNTGQHVSRCELRAAHARQ